MIQNYILNLNLVKEKTWTFEKHIEHLKSQAIYVDNVFFKNSLHVFKDGASSVQVGYIEHVLRSRNLCLERD